MIWAYVLENQGKTDLRNNQSVFQLINELPIEDANVIIDSDLDRADLPSLIDNLDEKDRLVCRSIVDLGDTLTDMLDVLQRLNEKKITLCSCEEDFLCGEDYLSRVTGVLEIHSYYTKRLKEVGYQRALEEGRVGRPPKAEKVSQALNLYQHGVKIEQIVALTGISKSTIYRNINKEDKKECSI